MESRAAEEILVDIEASLAALDVLVRGGAGSSGSGDDDPLRRRANECLDALAEILRLEALLAELKVRLEAAYADSLRGSQLSGRAGRL